MNPPASYFPSIEKKYGRPIAEWLELIKSSPLTKHMELVSWRKAEHGLGHGHANALVAATQQEIPQRVLSVEAPPRRTEDGKDGQ